MDRLAIAIMPEALQRLGIGKSAEPAKLLSMVGIQGELERQLAGAIAAEMEHPGLYGRLYVASLVNALLILLVRNHSEHRILPHSAQARGGLAPWQLRRVIDYLQQNLDDDVSLSQLAALVGLSQSHFSRVFRASTGLPPHQYQLTARVEHAKQLLLRGTLRLDEIAVACGFSEQSHLARVFRARMGVSPGAWRRERRS